MFVNMDRAGRLTTAERGALRIHARSAMDSIPAMIRGVFAAVMDALNEGDYDRGHIANAVWGFDMMADALQGMQILSDDLSTPTWVANHG